MKPTLLNEFPAMLRENHCYMSKGVIIIMKLARQYDNRVKFLKEINRKIPTEKCRQRIHDTEGALRYLVCFVALPLAKAERDQGWFFIEDGNSFLQTLDYQTMSEDDFEKADWIYRLLTLESFLKQNICLEKIKDLLEVPEC